MIVYLITNITNGKVYVGKTTRTLDYRWKRHLCDARLHPRQHIHHAIRKYGPESFTRRVLSHARSEKRLNDLERFYIAKYQSDRFGYNKTQGGEGFAAGDLNPRKVGYTMPPDQRKNISQALSGRSKTAVHTANIKKACAGRRPSDKCLEAVRKSLTGLKRGPMSQAHKDKLSKANAGKVPTLAARRASSERLLGTKQSAEQRKKISDGVKQNWLKRKGFSL
jgi:group I intron endonuclease